MKRIAWIGFVISFVFVSMVWGKVLWAQPKTIEIGWVGPLTGPSAESGVAMKQSAIMAMEEWNAKGGIYIEEYKKKIPVKILFEDCQSKPEVGISVAEKLIMRDKVNILLADAFHSHVTMAVMELAPKYGIPIMSIAPVSEEISKKVAKDPTRYWSFWKGDFGSTAYTKTFFYTYKHLLDKKEIVPKKKTLVSMVEDTDYGRSYAIKVKEMFESIGWKSEAVETVPLGQTDLYPQLTKIKAINPDILFTCFTALASGVAMVKQFHEVGLKSSHYAVYYPLRPEFIPQAGKSAEYLLWSPFSIDAESVPEHKEFAEKVRKRWNVTTNWEVAAGYDGVVNVFDSIVRAASLDPKKIVSAFSKLDRKGILGRYVFDQSNHEIKDGPDFLPVPTGQVIGAKSYIIWPETVAKRKYTVPPWTK